MTDEISIVLAFTAGLLSFLSPCVLPLIPSYLCLIGGISLPAGGTPGEPPGNRSRGGRLISGTLSFIIGFTTVFVLLSILFSHVFLLLGGLNRYVNLGAGIIVIILGCNVLFNFLSFLNYEKRFHFTGNPRTNGSPCPEGRGVVVRKEITDLRSDCTAGSQPRHLLHVRRFALKLPRRKAGSWAFDPASNKPEKPPLGIPGAFLMGGAFGAGWTPCVGPILGSILLLAGQRGKAGTAALYLSVYSAGLGLPFLGGAIFFDRFLNHAGKLRARLPWIQRISGVLLIVMGFLITLGHFESLSSRILEGQYRFITWALGEGEPVPGNPTLGNIRFLPAAVLLLCGILPPLTGVFRKRPVLRPGILIPSGLFCLLAAAQAAGLIDGLRLLALWLRRLQYLGNL